MFLFLKMTKIDLALGFIGNEIQQNKKKRSKPNNIFAAMQYI